MDTEEKGQKLTGGLGFRRVAHWSLTVATISMDGDGEENADEERFCTARTTVWSVTSIPSRNGDDVRLKIGERW
jgi:hypothetical protein